MLTPLGVLRQPHITSGREPGPGQRVGVLDKQVGRGPVLSGIEVGLHAEMDLRAVEGEKAVAAALPLAGAETKPAVVGKSDVQVADREDRRYPGTRRGVQLGTAVGQQVVAPGHVLVPGPGQVAGGGEHRGPVGEHRPGQHVAFRARDERAADPGHAALGPAPVGHRDEHPVGGRRGLRLDHLSGPLPLGPAVAGPVHRGRDEIGAVQGGQPGPLRELQVVADHHGDPPDLSVYRRQRRVAGSEDELLGIPQVRLAVDGAGAGRVHQGGAVVQAPVTAELAEAADYHQPVPGGQLVPLPQGDAVRGGCGQAARLGDRIGGVEDVAGVAQLGQDHEPRPRVGRLGDRVRGGPPVGVRLGHGDRELGDRYQGGVHFACSVRRDRTIDSILHWELRKKRRIVTGNADVVVVGGGHNGLVAAAYLARAGLTPVVCKRRAVTGGAAVSEHPFGPDYTVTSLSYVVSLLPPDLVRDLRLEQHGYRVYPQGPYFAPRADGRYLRLPHDPAQRHAEIAKFSAADADAYPRYEKHLAGIGQVLGPLLHQIPPRLGSRRPQDLLRQARLLTSLRAIDERGAVDVTRLLTGSIADLLEGYFESDAMLGLLSVSGVIGTWAGPRSAGTAYVMLHHHIGETDGASGADRKSVV